MQKTVMAKPIKPKAPLATNNGDALLGEGAAGALATGTGDANADGDLFGATAEVAETLSTLISTFCPAWQWPGTPHKKK